VAARLARRAASPHGLAAKIAGFTPVGTATMIVVLGGGLALRSLTAAL
jgi:hypothetical protein